MKQTQLQKKIKEEDSDYDSLLEELNQIENELNEQMKDLKKSITNETDTILVNLWKNRSQILNCMRIITEEVFDNNFNFDRIFQIELLIKLPPDNTGVQEEQPL